MSIFKRIFGRKKNEDKEINKGNLELLPKVTPIKVRREEYNKEEFGENAYFKTLEDKIATSGLSSSEDVIYRRLKGIKLEQERRYEEVLELYLENIDIYDKNPDDDSYKMLLDYVLSIVDLYDRTNQKEKQIPYLENAIQQYPNTPNVESWRLYLSKINKVNIKPKETLILPNDITKQAKNNPSLGERISLIKDELPEFNFYYDLPEESSESFYAIDIPREKITTIFELKNEINKLINQGKIAENERDLKTAIETYRKIIVEEVEDPFPYERLMIIYSKLKWLKMEINIIEETISFFSILKSKQLKHVTDLAEKYNMSHKVEERISQDKKIYYYDGKFELYSPHKSRLAKWEKRLKVKRDKLKK